MATITFKFPSKTIDGVVTLLQIDTWAQLTLSADDYAKFQAATIRNKIISEEAIINNTFIVESSYADDAHTIVNGWTIPNSENSPRVDGEWLTFWEQYIADKTLTWPA